MSNLAKDIMANLSPAKRALLLQRLSEKKDDVSRTRIRPRESESNSFPLSYAQQRLWFLDQLEPGSRAYAIPGAVRLSGPLQFQALAKSVRQIVQRHESLRTIFVAEQGTPMQVIAPDAQMQVPLIDLSGLPAALQEHHIQSLAQQEAGQPFVLSRGPLLRLHLLRLQAQQHVLLMSMHHIISDGWSIGVLVGELTELYRAAVHGERQLLPPLPIQYADYALWQRSWLQGERLQEQITYWQQQLAQVSGLLTLPLDRARPAVQSYVGAQQVVRWPAALRQALERLSQREGVTLFMTLLASFQVLLMRWSGQHDIVIGTPVANRQQKELEGLIGFFVNTLVMRTDLSGNPSFRQVLARVREVALQAYAHQDLPFEQLVSALPTEHSSSYSPLFQILFVLENTPQEARTLEALTVQAVEFEVKTSKFDLTVEVQETEQGLRAAIIYNTDLFETGTIQRLLQHWQILLEGIVTNPEQRLSTLPLLTAVEREQMLIAWNATSVVYPHNLCLHLVFEEQAERAPDTIAVVFEEERCTYQELNRRANQLAHYLCKKGVGPDVLVGLYVERSANMIVGVLAILKAGGAYVPLDPASPAERLKFIIDDPQIAFVLTQQSLQDRCAVVSKKLILLDVQGAFFDDEKDTNVGRDIQPGNLAYVIYTSGSTGRPKGVLVEHGQLSNYVRGIMQLLGLDSTTSFAMVQPIEVDSCITVLYSALCTGGCLYLISRELAIDPEGLENYFSRHPIDLLKIAPSHLAALLNVSNSQQLLPRKWLIIGGEASRREWVQHLQTLAPRCAIFNHYGPTEATVGMLTYNVREDGLTVLPLGRPLPNAEAYILDEHLNPVPIGVPGELYIGGKCLARGYLHLPDLTADRFIPHPFAICPGERLYKTGDRVRFLVDGNIEYLGRLDGQVKIRGFRIELGEIEAVLRQHPAVKECIAIVREDVPGNKLLVAYVVLAEAIDSVEIIKQHVRAYLPTYMQPSLYVLLETLPLSPHGKVNLKALPVPEDLHGDTGSSYVAPQTEIEQSIVAAWREVLPVTQIGLKDNFFDLGGHSLLATQLIARLQQMMGIEIPLRTLFDKPTVAEFATWLTQQLHQDQGDSVPAIVPVPRSQELPLSFAQQRLWFLNQLEPGNSAYSIPTAVRLRGQLDRAALEQALVKVIRRHEVLRTTFPARRGQPVQRIAEEPTTQLVILDLSYLAPQERESVAQRLVQQEVEQPFSLARGPLLHCWLLSLSQEDQILLLTMHHIISDGWSMNILVQELTSLYTAFTQGTATDLPPLPIQYADYAFWQRSWLQGEVLEQQLDYWKQQLSGSVPLALPTDYPRPAIQTARGGRQHLRLPIGLSQQVHALSQREGTTLFMTLLAAFTLLLHYCSGQDDLVVGTNVANRNRAETEGVIGFFVNQLVLRTNLSGNPSVRGVLGRVKDVALGAYAHQDLPFDRLLVELNPERDLSHTPLFQAKFALEHVHAQPGVLPAIQVEPVSLEQTVTKFDLFLIMVESDGDLTGSLDYRTDLFREETMTRLLHLFAAIVEQMVSFPERRLSEIDAVIAEIDAEQRSGQERARRQRNAQKLGQLRRKTNP